jgi:hypothetical protein
MSALGKLLHLQFPQLQGCGFRSLRVEEKEIMNIASTISSESTVDDGNCSGWANYRGEIELATLDFRLLRMDESEISWVR